MKFRISFVIALLFLAQPLFAEDVAAWSNGLLAGNADRVWMIRSGETGPSSDIFVRPLGESWRLVLRNQTGQPISAVAVGEQLRLFYPDRQHVIVDDKGQTLIGANLPGSLLAACNGNDRGKNEETTVYVLVRQSTRPTKGLSPASRPHTAPTAQGATTQPTPQTRPTSKRTPPLYECLYRAAGNDWRLVSARVLPAEPPQLHTPRFLAMADGDLYWLGRNNRGPRPRPYVLRRYTPDLREASWTDLHTLPAEQTPLGMINIGHRILVVTREQATQPETPTTLATQQSLTLLRYDPNTQPKVSSLPITKDGSPAIFPSDAKIRAARLGEQIALLWTETQELRFSLCMQTGTLNPAENVSQVLKEMPDIEHVTTLYNYFLLGVVIVIGVGMFFKRMRTPPRPFLLAEGLIPANLLKRLLAVMIDFSPFYFLAATLFMPTHLSLDDIQRIFQHPQSSMPNYLAAAFYTFMLSSGLYVIYGTIMEMRFGATIGKMLLRLRTVREDGSRPDLRAASLRNTTKIVELSMLFSPLLGWLMMLLVLLPLLTKNRQRLGDMVARTAVVEAHSLSALASESKSDNTSGNENKQDKVSDEP